MYRIMLLYVILNKYTIFNISNIVKFACETLWGKKIFELHLQIQIRKLQTQISKYTYAFYPIPDIDVELNQPFQPYCCYCSQPYFAKQ